MATPSSPPVMRASTTPPTWPVLPPARSAGGHHPYSIGRAGSAAGHHLRPRPNLKLPRYRQVERRPGARFRPQHLGQRRVAAKARPAMASCMRPRAPRPAASTSAHRRWATASAEPTRSPTSARTPTTKWPSRRASPSATSTAGWPAIPSRAVSNAVLDVSVDQPLQVANNFGRMPWDAPNRLLGWGYLPLPRQELGGGLPGGLPHRLPLCRDQRHRNGGGPGGRAPLSRQFRSQSAHRAPLHVSRTIAWPCAWAPTT